MGVTNFWEAIFKYISRLTFENVEITFANTSFSRLSLAYIFISVYTATLGILLNPVKFSKWFGVYSMADKKASGYESNFDPYKK